jgi:predicted outer membrane repeat protein
MGAGIRIQISNFTILNSTFDSNLAENGGAIYIIDSNSAVAVINHTNITNNKALGSGGGIYIENSEL